MMEKSRDLINRQDAVDAICRGCVREVFCKEEGEQVCDITLSIHTLPSASVEVGEWIPCSERLPKDLQKAITCNKHGEMMIGTYTEWGWMFPCYFEKPIAWMPLPKPYKGGDSE